MKIKVRKSYAVNENATLIEEGALYFLNDLLYDNEKKDLVVVISICKMNKSDHGDAWLNKNKGYIRINSQINFLDQITTLAHECIHIRQFRRKQLEVINNEYVWHGNKHREWKTMDCRLYPWEIEAYSMQSTLAFGFIHKYLHSLQVEFYDIFNDSA